MMTMFLFPFIGFISCCLLGSKMGPGCKIVPVFFMFLTVLSSFTIFLDCINNSNYSMEMSWFSCMSSSFYMYVDLISSSMLMLVSSMSLMVHLYSTSYMDGDPHLQSFMGYLSLFTFFMMMLVTSNNLIQMFMGWEGVGLCSFLLISFWFTSVLAGKAAFKAMAMNKVGDVGLLMGMFLMFMNFGSLCFSEFIPNYYTMEMMTVFLLIGVMGKSAQMGLHMWLPDAMEGPTPVSALMHAATMVTAGVFLIMSLSPMFDLSPLSLMMMVMMGGLTSFFSACMSLTQNDMKKMIAYSTCSQLGYMVTMCGFSHYSSGLFHLLNHGFFKALLFLSAGSVIHAINDQDMSKMGNLKEKLPVSYISMFVGSISLMGLPFLTGFYSKDLLLELIFQEHFLSFALWLGIVSAFLTSFYSFSLAYYVFFNYPNHNNNVHSEDNIIAMPLMMLLMLSCSVGYLLQNFMLLDMKPVMMTNNMKQLPLLVSIMGSTASMMVGYYMMNIFNLYFKMSTLYSFLLSLWYFDNIINSLNLMVVKKAFWINYKFMDNQIMESLGPTYFMSKTGGMSGKLSSWHIGEMSMYVFMFMMSFVVLSW